MDSIAISDLNYVGNTVFDLNDYGLYPGIIFMGVGNLQIQNCYFVDSIFTGRGDVAVYDKTYFDYNDNYITLINCFADGESYKSDRIITKDCNFDVPKEEITTLLIDDLYNCEKFYQTKSFLFTFSDEFTSSNYFSITEKFSNSAYFSNSVYFSNSLQFSASNTNPSKYFSDSKSFTDSDYFSLSKSFTNFDYFSLSKSFTDSDEFKNLETTTIPSNAITKLSMSIVMTSVKSVSFCASYYNDFTYIQYFDNEQNTYVYIQSEYFTLYYRPMIIYYLSPSYVEVIQFQSLEKIKKTLSQSQLIGIVCGSIAAFFLLLYIGIFIYQKKTYNYLAKDFSSEISESENEIEIRTVNDTINTENINNVIEDNWL